MKSAYSSSLAQDTTAMGYSAEVHVAAEPQVARAPLPASRAPQARPGRERSPKENPSFGPDVILPEQFYDAGSGMEEVSGERALMLAVLEDGIRCFQEHLTSPRVRPRLLARQAEKWIRSGDWDWPFSFNNICESLALDPDSLRERLLAPRPAGERPRARPSSHRVYRLTPRVKPPRRR